MNVFTNALVVTYECIHEWFPCHIWMHSWMDSLSLMTHYAVCCSMLQYVAVCCSVLPYVAVCCSVLQYIHCHRRHKWHMSYAACCSMLQYVAVCCRKDWMHAREVCRVLLISYIYILFFQMTRERCIECCASHHTLPFRIHIYKVLLIRSHTYIECCSFDYTLCRVLLISCIYIPFLNARGRGVVLRIWSYTM